MAKYFLDTEFIEGFRSPIFGRRRHFIDLISIGIVCDDGREYHAVGKEFNPNDADGWVKQNVLYPIMLENGYPKHLSNLHGHLQYDASAIREIQSRLGKSNRQIADDIIYFTNPHMHKERGDYDVLKLLSKSYVKNHRVTDFAPNDKCPMYVWRSQPEFYGYYSDYDWVLFCSLFGRMADLPTGFPKHCIDLKQMIDDKARGLTSKGLGRNPTFEDKLNFLKNHSDYPKQTNEHNALADAKWNKELYDFIKQSR